ncbi:MAG: glycosyltransferase family 4 protein [Patescibacteria group bacterium]
MKRSLFVTLDYPPRVGGVARVYTNLIRRLPPDRVLVLAPPERQDHLFDRREPYRIIRRSFYTRLPLLWPKWLPLLITIFRLVRREHVECIHVGQVLPIGTAVLLLQKFFHVPYIVYSHGLDVTAPQAWPRKKRLIQKILNQAAAIVANSEFTKQEIIRLGVPADKILVLTPACSLLGAAAGQGLIETVRRRHNLDGREVLLTVGRLEERKGQDSVIRALGELLPRHPQLVYVVVGAGPDEQRLHHLADECQVAGQVIFAGRIPDEELPAYYQNCDVFCMPSRELSNRDVEGFGIVYLEANAYGKPVVGGKSGGVAEAIIDGQTGLLVSPGDQPALVQAIDRLLTDQAFAVRLGRAGQARVEKEFNWETRARVVRQLIERLP